MSEKTTTAKSTTKHSGNYDTLVDLVAGGCCVVHGVRVPEGHELGLEIFERFFLKFSTMLPQLCLPEVSDVVLNK